MVIHDNKYSRLLNTFDRNMIWRQDIIHFNKLYYNISALNSKHFTY